MCPIFGSKLFQDIQLIYKKTKIVNIHKFSWIISFVKHFWNLYYTYWPNCVLLDKLTNLFIFDLANTQPTLYYVLSIDYDSTSYFSSFDMHLPHALVGCQATGINSLSIIFTHLFCCLYFLYQVVINNFRIATVKIIIIKINIIKICTINDCIIAKECNNIRLYITKDYIIIRNTALSSFSIILFVKNQTGTNFNAGRKASTASSQISWILYLPRQYFSIKFFFWKQLYHEFLSHIFVTNRIKYKRTSINSFMKHFLSLMAFKNQLHCRWIGTNSFITHFLGLILSRGKS